MTPSYQKLRNMVRQQIDQTMRTRNFKARSERIETGVLVKGHKVEMSAITVRDCYPWNANGQCSKGDSYSF